MDKDTSRHARLARLYALAAAIALATIGTASCQGDMAAPASPAGSTVLDARMLVGAAREALGPDGRFHAQDGSADAAQSLSSGDALASAQAYWNAFGLNLRFGIERDRSGEHITVESTAPCGQAYLAQSSLSPAAGALSAPRAMLIGAQWIVPMCDAGVTKAVIAVAAQGERLSAPALRRISVEQLNAEIQVAGVPDGARLVVSPEDAAAFAYAQTGLRVRTVPYLVRAESPVSGWYAIWSIELESGALVRGRSSGRERTVARVLVGANLRDGFRLALLDSEEPLDGRTTADVFDGFGARSDAEARRPIRIMRDPQHAFQMVEAIQPISR